MRPRWWVRRGRLVDGAQSYRTETIGLVFVPFLAQLALAVAVVAVPGMPGTVVAVLVIGEIGVGVVLALWINYRRVLPLVFYPAWLRPDRRREMEWLRSQR